MPTDSQVEHVVVLMLENRSFDHLLGHLDHGSLDPVTSALDNVQDVANPDGPRYPVHFLSSDGDVTVDPGHSHEDVTRQLTCAELPLSYDQINMGGFAWNYAKRLADKDGDPSRAGDIMGCHTADQVPVLSTLAREYAVCSRWFCSVPSETWPNRLFAHAAQSDGLLENVIRPYTHRTTFDVLRDAKVPWAIYAGDVPQTAAYFELVDAFRDRFNPLSEFYEDVRDGSLPRYSFLEPRHFRRVDSQHPTHSVMLGDQLLRSVYNALASNPDIWQSVLLIVTWDEHGGFYDRVRPERTVPPSAGVQSKEGFAFDILGVRVPALVISPFVAPLTVSDQTYDHASIVRTVFEAFGLDEQLTDRDAQAASVLDLLTQQDARTPVVLPPNPSRTRGAVTDEGATGPVRLDDLQLGLVDLAKQLDAHRAPNTRSMPRDIAEGVGATASGVEIDRLVAHFQVEHMGERTQRMIQDAAMEA